MGQHLILSVVGARPNFMKIAPIHREIARTHGLAHFLVHTGQHYDDALSRQFFNDLDIPEADINLQVGSGLHGEQTGEMLKRLESVFIRKKPDIVLVVGDVNSTLAASLAAAKLHIPIAHVEAGLRSFDRRMPEEINRVLTDALADLLFVTEEAGMKHLEREGIPREKCHLVGDVMIDSVLHALPAARERAAPRKEEMGSAYAVMTLHRPSNVDDPEQLASIVRALGAAPRTIPILFPVHPRTAERLEAFELLDTIKAYPHIHLLPPLGYLEFLGLLESARFTLTDSGGIQSEAAFLGVPCLTMRDTTERPQTVERGFNHLLGTNASIIPEAIHRILADERKPPVPLPLSDGKASQRIIRIIQNRLAERTASGS